VAQQGHKGCWKLPCFCVNLGGSAAQLLPGPTSRSSLWITKGALLQHCNNTTIKSCEWM
jgi:hypothetical protein